MELQRKELKRSAEAQESTQRALSEQVEAMRSTARINALQLVIKSYDEKIELEAISVKKIELSLIQGRYEEELEKMIRPIAEGET